MARVICELPNVVGKINGILFTPDRGQLLSEELSDVAAAYFAGIPGYRVVAPPPPVPAPQGKGRKPAATPQPSEQE